MAAIGRDNFATSFRKSAEEMLARAILMMEAGITFDLTVTLTTVKPPVYKGSFDGQVVCHPPEDSADPTHVVQLPSDTK